MTLRNWYIYGAGGLGAETMDVLQRAIAAGTVAPHRCAFLVDDPLQSEVIGFPVIAVSELIAGSRVTIGVGEPAARRKLREKVLALGLELSSVISPDAIVSPSATIGPGAIIAPLCSIQAKSVIGENVAVNTMAIIGHDVVVDADSVISSMVNLGGAVHIGPCSYVGMGALIKEHLTVGHSSIVGMGSLVHASVPDQVIAFGDPARVARRNEEMKVFRA